MVQKKRNGWSVQDIKEWFGSYLVILIIPIVICSVFFLYTCFVVWTETKEANTAALQVVNSELERVYEESVLLEYRIQNNQSVKEASRAEDPLDAEGRFRLVRAAQEVSAYVGSSNWLASWYVYFPENKRLITAGNAYMDWESGYERIGKACGYMEEEWNVLLNRRNASIFLRKSADGPVAKISSLPIRSGAMKMNVILELSQEYLQNTLSYLDDMKNSTILLTDLQDQVLVSRGLEDFDREEIISRMKGGTGYQTITANGKRMMASCIESTRSGFKIISLIPYKEFWKRALKSLFLFLFALALCILTGMAFCIIFAMAKQRTWGRMQKLVSQKLEENPQNQRFRNKEVMAAVENIVQEYDAMQKQLTSVDSMKKELLITAALRGRIRPEDAVRVFEKNGVSYAIGNFAVILFAADRFDPFSDEERKEDGHRNIEQMKKAVVTVLSEVCEQEFAYEILNLEEKIVCIVDFGKLEKETCREKTARLARMEAEKTYPNRPVFQRIAISDIHSHIFSLQTAYSEASRVMEYQLLKGKEPVLSYMEMIRQTRMGYLYSMENEAALIRWICEGKKDAAQKLFEEIYEKNIETANGSEQLRSCLMWNLTASVLRAENELREKVEFPDMQKLLEEMSLQIASREGKELLKERIGVICAEAAKARGQKKDYIAEQIKEYIEQHASDPNLSNSQIAEAFRMNVSYLSTFFKEKTGMSPLDYIHRVRLARAKKLLDETNLTVEVISAKVGCNNSITLTRLFKKYEGMTAAEYKKKA